MLMRDTTAGYGLVSRLFHWITALVIFGLFGLGVWMVGLGYYDPYYTTAPHWHKSVGMLLAFALVARFVWRVVNVKPSDDGIAPLERILARVAHWSFYVLLFAIVVTGYLMSTADGRPIHVFDWFAIPSPGTNPGLESTAGAVHVWLSYAVMALAAVHTLAALKHHFYDRKPSLTRMWSGPPQV